MEFGGINGGIKYYICYVQITFIMATIKFYPYKNKGASKIYFRLTINRNLRFLKSTGLTIEDSAKWNADKQRPKASTENNKRLKNRLNDFECGIFDVIDEVEKNPNKSFNDITSKVIHNFITDFNNETLNHERTEYLSEFAELYAKSLTGSTYTKNGVKHRYSQSTIDKYHNFTKHLTAYDNYLKSRVKIRDIDNTFADDFNEYLSDENNLAPNTRGRYIKRLKTLLIEADKEGYTMANGWRDIQGFEDENVVTILTFDEVDKIIKTKMPNKKLELAKDWLVIGCYTAQRISDLFRMHKGMIDVEKGYKRLTLRQYKTSTTVYIPLHYKVDNILKKYNNNFPPNLYKNEKSNRTQLSQLMKQVCKAAGLNRVVRGRYNGVIGDYPLYKLIQNHTCRRTFASNFYGKEGWSTPMIMSITGHKTEKSFLKYIDKEHDYMSEGVYRNFVKMQENENKKESNLRIVNND